MSTTFGGGRASHFFPSRLCPNPNNPPVSGFGVADTHVLFALTPPEAPARMLVIAAVVRHSFSGLAPILSGIVLDRLLETAEAPLGVYHVFFAILAVSQALCFLPLRGFRRVTA